MSDTLKVIRLEPEGPEGVGLQEWELDPADFQSALDAAASRARASKETFDRFSEVFERGLVPVALELIDQATIRLVEASVFAVGLPTDVAAALVIECEGDPEDVEADLAIAAAACREHGASEVRVATDETERLAIWQARKKAYGALGRLAPDVFVQDAAVPRSALPELLPKFGEFVQLSDWRGPPHVGAAIWKAWRRGGIQDSVP